MANSSQCVKLLSREQGNGRLYSYCVSIVVNSFNFWPLLAGSLGIPLYLWFKFTLSNVTRDWNALLKDGLASAIGFSWLGLWLFLGYDNVTRDWNALLKDGLASAIGFSWLGLWLFLGYDSWLHWIGLGIFVWSLTFWLSTGVAWQRVRAEKKGEKPAAPFSKPETPASKGPNRQQRRARRKS